MPKLVPAEEIEALAGARIPPEVGAALRALAPLNHHDRNAAVRLLSQLIWFVPAPWEPRRASAGAATEEVPGQRRETEVFAPPVNGGKDIAAAAAAKNR